MALGQAVLSVGAEGLCQSSSEGQGNGGIAVWAPHTTRTLHGDLLVEGPFEGNTVDQGESNP